MPEYCNHSFKDLCKAAYGNDYKIYLDKLYSSKNQQHINSQVKHMVKIAKWNSKTVKVNNIEFEAFSPNKI